YEEKIAGAPDSPLASGRVARPWTASSTRLETDPIAKMKYDATADADKQIVDRVAELAEKYGIPMAHVSLAWMLHKNPVVAPVIGATKIPHLESAVEAVSVELTSEDIAYLEEPYVPHPIVGLKPYDSRLLNNQKSI
ncbi:MAG: aldo/keto reductase, partial [Anaerolineales bacterium]|nr:aldo/keto reductase [Anaerolineales bacterium]